MNFPTSKIRRLGFILLLGVSATWVGAHVRLIYSGNGKALYWTAPESISVVINSDGSDDLEDMTHVPALRNAVDAWNGVTGTRARLIENTSTQAQNSRNWSSSQYHMMLFDESNSSGFFPPGSGIVAVTPLTFFTTGQIIDADVLFNGNSFQFTTSSDPGAFDVQDVATHELGHLLGLDHSGCAGATMYPYVDPTVILHRSLSADDARGIESVYPVSQKGSIKGSVRRAGPGSVVKGAWVGVRDAQGRLVAAALTNSTGNFTLSSLSPGTYRVYATPLDYPVSASNLGAGRTIQTDFESTLSSFVTVSGTSATNMGSLLVGADTLLSLGRASDNYPLRVSTGQTTSLVVRGAGLGNGVTLESSDPSMVISNVAWLSSRVSFKLTVPAGSSLGHADLTVTDSAGRVSILSAALEITPPNPQVTLASPSYGPSTGGVGITLLGTGFRSGARVVVGDQVYVDGKPGGCVVASDSSITLTTRSSIPGLHDVTVIDASGVEGRSVEAYLAQATPVVNSAFPSSGVSVGGTVLTLTGQNFVSGCRVEINGVDQSQTTVLSLTQIAVITEVGVPGGPYSLSVITLDGQSASVGFSYVVDPDPVLQSANPDAVLSAGGETVTLQGIEFREGLQVRVGVHPLTGAGGQSAITSFVDHTTLTIQTPAMSTGSIAILVQDPLTQQASILPGALSVTGPAQDSVGGGCGMISPGGPTTLTGLLAGTGWILVLVAWFGHRRRRWHPQVA
ncbi:MAG TPA: matrixin family metalloprotease [Planctomycetes bacterium]|nr:matrixin family metalloprotease [Planctomycetota bacterium]